MLNLFLDLLAGCSRWGVVVSEPRFKNPTPTAPMGVAPSLREEALSPPSQGGVPKRSEGEVVADPSGSDESKPPSLVFQSQTHVGRPNPGKYSVMLNLFLYLLASYAVFF